MSPAVLALLAMRTAMPCWAPHSLFLEPASPMSASAALLGMPRENSEEEPALLVEARHSKRRVMATAVPTTRRKWYQNAAGGGPAGGVDIVLSPGEYWATLGRLEEEGLLTLTGRQGSYMDPITQLACRRLLREGEAGAAAREACRIDHAVEEQVARSRRLLRECVFQRFVEAPTEAHKDTLGSLDGLGAAEQLLPRPDGIRVLEDPDVVRLYDALGRLVALRLGDGARGVGLCAKGYEAREASLGRGHPALKASKLELDRLRQRHGLRGIRK